MLNLHSFPTRRSSDLSVTKPNEEAEASTESFRGSTTNNRLREIMFFVLWRILIESNFNNRSEEHTSELQSHVNLVCRLLLEKKNSKCSTNTRFALHAD